MKTYLDILDHAAAYCYFMPCTRFNIQTGQKYLRRECSHEKQPVSMLVIASSYCIFCIFPEMSTYLLFAELM